MTSVWFVPHGASTNLTQWGQNYRSPVGPNSGLGLGFLGGFQQV